MPTAVEPEAPVRPPPAPPAAPATPAAPAGPAAAVAERPAPPRTDHLPPFKVLLHNDDVNDAEHVVRSLVAHTPLSVARAIDVMTEAHNTGVALVVTTHQELAELYQGQLQSLGLTSTIEPA